MSEQYDLDGKSYVQSIAVAIINYRPAYLYIRDVGSMGGTVRVSRRLRRNDLLVIERVRGGFSVRVNGAEVFFFAVTRSPGYMWGTLWRLEYWRQHPGAVSAASINGPYENPDDSRLSEIKESVLRSVDFGHLIEVRFRGKVHLARTRKAPPHRGSGGYYREIILPS